MEDRSVNPNISLKQSLIDGIDNDIVGKSFKNRSEYISHLVEKDLTFGRYDKLMDMFGTIFYPVIIFVLLFSFSFITTGFVQLLFFLLAGFAGVILIMLFFMNFIRYRGKKRKHVNNDK